MIKNLVKETANNPSTGTSVNLGGAPTGYKTFLSEFGAAAPLWYFITDGTQTEANTGQVTAGSPNTLSRGTPLWTSTGSGSRLNFTGAVTIYCALPASQHMYADASNVWQAQSRRMAGLADGTGLQDSATLNQVAWRKISTTTFGTATGSVGVTLPAGLRRFRIEYVIQSAAAAAAYLQLSTDGGSTWKAGASDYNWVATSVRAASAPNAGSAASYVTISDAVYASGASIHGSVDFDCTLNYGTADAMTLLTGPVLGRWVAGFTPAFAGASTAARIGIVGNNMSSGVVTLSGNY